MATPEIRAQEPEQLHNPDLSLAGIAGAVAIEQTVDFIPDYLAMSAEEYKAFVHWTALSGDIAGTSPEDLLAISQALYARQREIGSHTAALTVRVSNLQAELASSDDKQSIMDEMISATQTLSDLHHELIPIHDKQRWVRGYIKDRQPQPV